MNVKSLTSREPIVVEIGTPLRVAAQIMVKEKIGFLPIVSPSDHRRVLGVISERDFVRAFAQHRGLDDLNVEDVGTMEGLVKIREDEEVSKAAQLMLEHNVRHLIVVDKNDKLVGVVSLRDIVKIEEILEHRSKS
ncbi:MAG: CBS domain-containing protein [Infirmifilum sp.]|uniref:CBS domain-containing protein n=1 Tax=Infirmifilum uzonense TaxID=1550241 RepID=A0A0F7CKY4_9CREN|nr:CBS domain-containing protein [Infirmifilum uzonense]AKG38466.1 hypothetical protein MA03_03095 [Infirmifilum uzonense]